MDRNTAKDKIYKLLRLANDKGATESERDNALKMAEKLASKYSFKIEKSIRLCHFAGVETAAEVKTKYKVVRYEFELKCFNKKLVTYLLEQLNSKSYSGYIFLKPNTVVVYTEKEFDTAAFKKFYSKFVNLYHRERIHHKEYSAEDFYLYFIASFRHGVISEQVNTAAIQSAMKLGQEFRDFRNAIIH